MLLILFALVTIAAVALLYGKSHWESGARELRDRLEAGRVPVKPGVFNRRELEGLPAPVQRFFHTVLKEGQPIVAAVSVEHVGTFNMGETAAKWKSFSSTQRVVTSRPGFV